MTGTIPKVLALRLKQAARQNQITGTVKHHNCGSASLDNKSERMAFGYMSDRCGGGVMFLRLLAKEQS